MHSIQHIQTNFSDLPITSPPSGVRLQSTASDKTAILASRLGAFFSAPIGKTRELFYMQKVAKKLDPNTSVFSKLEKFLLFSKMIVCGAISPFTAPVAIFFYFLAALLERRNFFHLANDSAAKDNPNCTIGNKISYFIQNICGIEGGFSISDGGVFPLSFEIEGASQAEKTTRLEKIIRQILEQDKDIVCLFEVFVPIANCICNELKKHGYTYSYFNMGMKKMIGITSGMLVSSKYPIENFTFIPFPQEALWGKAAYVAKGVFGCTVGDFRIYGTHLQYSELPQFPIKEEEAARKKELRIIMQFLLEDMKETKSKVFVLTGDLNMDNRELDSFFTPLFELNRFQGFEKKVDSSLKNQATWGGDIQCASLVGKKASEPLALDHVIIIETPNSLDASIKTELLSDGFEAAKFSADKTVLSDHKALVGEIEISRKSKALKA